MTALFERQVVRCDGCKLTQFLMLSNLCRRCRKNLAPEPEPAPVTAPLVLVAEPKAREVKLGATVRNLRLAQHLTQTQLATRMGARRTYLSKVEGDKLAPTLPLLRRLAAALGVDIHTLLGEPRVSDPFLSELAQYVTRLDSGARDFIINTVRSIANRA